MNREELKEVIEDNSLYDCVEAYNNLCEELRYDDDKIYHYSEILEYITYQIEAEPSSIENVLIDFADIGSEYSIYTMQKAFYIYNGYGNIELIEDETIKESIINLLFDNFNENEIENKLEELFLI